MTNLFSLLFLASIFGFILGFVRPTLFSRFVKNPSRKKLSIIFIIAIITFSMLAVLIAGPSKKKTEVQPQTEVKTTEKAENTPTPTPLPTLTPTPTETPKPSPTPKPTVFHTSVIENINSFIAEKYPNFEITIWNKDLNLASEGQTPYEIILNGSFNKTIASNCDEAKKLSYYMLETLYKDNDIRPTISRVMITIPGYLRVSLGANDGVPMAENNSFSGPTNFWSVMEKMGLGENESGEMKNRTWGVYLTKCQ